MRREIYVLLRALLASGALLALWGCNENVGETPGAFDPCERYEKVVGRLADFEVNRTFYGLYVQKVIEEPDSILIGQIFSISAKHEADLYEWEIGNLYFRTPEKTLFVDVDDYPNFPSGSVKIRLKATTDTIGRCFSGGYTDSSSKEVYFYPKGSIEKTKTKYSGYYSYQNVSAPTDSGYFWIKDSLAPPGYHSRDFYIIGFFRDCPEFHFAYARHNYVQFFSDGARTCKGDGFINFSGNGPRYTMEFYPAEFTEDPENLYVAGTKRKYTIKKVD